MNNFKTAIDGVLNEYKEEDGHDNVYHCYTVSFQIFTAMNPSVNPDTVSDIPEFVALNKAVWDITQMQSKSC